MLAKYSYQVRAILLCCAACLGSTLFAADEPRLLPGAEAASETALVGTVVRSWNEARQRHEFTILDERDEIQYTILSGAGIDRTALVGQRVELQGRTRLHEGFATGLVYPQHAQRLDHEVQQASFLLDEHDRVAYQLPRNISMAGPQV